jgi:hypothetical protein
MSKLQEKQKAIKLREEGCSYSEILKQIPVAKSTLSLWLRSVGLSKKQKQRLTEKKLAAALRGAKKRREQRITLTNKIYQEAGDDIKRVTKNELWLMGTMLYWAEGSKEKERGRATGIQFSNSDAFMIKLFLKWLFDVCKISRERIRLEIYIHNNHKYRLKEIIEHWIKYTGFSKSYFSSIYFKKGNPETKRTNIGRSYYGVLRIKVKASSDLNRRITGWIKGINKYYWGVV